MENKKREIGKNGVPFNVIQVTKTPLERIEDVGKRMRIREELDQRLYKKPLNKQQKKRMAMIVEKIHKDVRIYLKSKSK